jgi:hypothetical protein
LIENFVVRYRLPPLLALAGLLSTCSALAESSPHDPASAEVLFREGRTLVVAGDYPHACPKFAESLRLDYAPGTLLNLADCEEHTGRIATAWAHFRDLSTELPSTDERQPMAAQRARALEPRLPHLTVRSSTALRHGTKVMRDDVELGQESLDVALPVDPGMHIVVVNDGDRERSRVQVEVGEGQSRVVVADDATGSTASGTRTAGWIAGGLAVAAFATGASFGILALSNSSAANANCTGGVCGDAASARQYDEARSQARVADVALGVGLVATVVASILLVSSRKSDAPSASSMQLTSLALGRVTW